MNWNACSEGGIATLGCIGPLATYAIRLALGFVGTVSLFLIIAAGIMFITSGGGKQVEQAKNMLTYAIVGLLVVLLAVFIVGLVAGITGVTCILGLPGTSCQ